MFDHNQFKRAVKEWIRTNPNGSLADLTDFCEEQIPPAAFTANQWLVEQTVTWYRYILSHREASAAADEENDAA